MVYKALLCRDVFWISYIKLFKFCNNNLLVVLGSKQGGVETCEPQTGGLSVNSIVDSPSLNFLIYFVEISSYFSTKLHARPPTLLIRDLWV